MKYYIENFLESLFQRLSSCELRLVDKNGFDYHIGYSLRKSIGNLNYIKKNELIFNYVISKLAKLVCPNDDLERTRLVSDLFCKSLLEIENSKNN